MSRGGSSARPGAVYHLISRFVAKQWFIESTRERNAYLSLIGYELERTDWRCFSYAVMSNHIHLGLVAGHAKLASWLREPHKDFALWINERLERIGGVFVKGPELIEYRPAATKQLINYIHNNPVRAGVVSHVADTDWTSHQAYLGIRHSPRWLDRATGLALAGFETGKELDAWIDRETTDKEQIEALRVTPRPTRGRPRKLTDPKEQDAAKQRILEFSRPTVPRDEVTKRAA